MIYHQKRIIPLLVVLLFLALTGSCSSVSSDINCDNEYEVIIQKYNIKSRPPVEQPNYYNNLATDISKALLTCPKHIGLKVLMANTQVSLGKNITALAYVSEALEIDENNAEALHTKGMIMSMEGQTDESLYLLKRSLKLEPDNVNYHVNYCSTLESIGEYQQAIDACSRAIDLGHVPAVVFYIRGRSYEATGNQKHAMTDYNQAKALGFPIDNVELYMGDGRMKSGATDEDMPMVK
jgi:tetratricopeptide (TPR) repeat protein